MTRKKSKQEKKAARGRSNDGIRRIIERVILDLLCRSGATDPYLLQRIAPVILVSDESDQDRVTVVCNSGMHPFAQINGLRIKRSASTQRLTRLINERVDGFSAVPEIEVWE